MQSILEIKGNYDEAVDDELQCPMFYVEEFQSLSFPFSLVHVNHIRNCLLTSFHGIGLDLLSSEYLLLHLLSSK